MNAHSVTSQIPAADVELSGTTSAWHSLGSIWRHLVAMVLLAVIVFTYIQVQLSVNRTVEDIDRHATLIREASIQHERLELELQTRRRALRLEKMAAELQLTPQVEVVDR